LLVDSWLVYVLYVFFVLAHDRRRVLHFNVTEHPSAAWTAQQIIETFPEDTAPKYMVRDRDGIYGDQIGRRILGDRDYRDHNIGACVFASGRGRGARYQQ
jgi:hypothetical protein